MNDRTRMHRHQSRQEQRAPLRDPARSETGGRVVLGRDGQEITRKRRGNNDPLYIAPEMIPDGWSYEWKREETYGQQDVSHQVGLQENGWAPVTADRHPGLFMPANYIGPIRRDGLILMERPIELTQEARDEEQFAARSLMRAQHEQYAGRMPQGLDADHPGARPRINRTYEAPPSDLARAELPIEG